ncbi:MAG: hypothetical protein D6689_07595 [Deltaproteobacteria bacterium]|nr:MAG: hypothetical protein D6689_07595 [Deltaproteobacteria bacterium]
MREPPAARTMELLVRRAPAPAPPAPRPARRAPETPMPTSADIAPDRPSVAALLEQVRDLTKHNRWQQLASLRSHLSTPLRAEELEIADGVAFALGQLGDADGAANLLAAACAIDLTHRRASALAYVHYNALFACARARPGKGRGAQLAADRERHRQAFLRWTRAALDLQPDSIKDLYRLGVFEAQLGNRRDRPALRAFERAIDAYRRLDDATRERRGDLRKYYAKALYAAARSALRLGQVDRARKHAFACLRADDGHDHVEPVHKLYLAGKICAAAGEHDHAERALRKALDAAGKRKPDYLYGALAAACFALGRLDDAHAWIDRNVPPPRRRPDMWRLLGDIAHRRGDVDAALAAYEHALRGDRAGRHLTLHRIGDIHLAAGRLAKADSAYRRAAEFRRKRFASEDVRALEGRLAVADARGDEAAAAELRAALADARARARKRRRRR